MVTILSADIDDTIYGDYSAMRHFHNATAGARADGKFFLIYNTGREINSIWDLCRYEDLPCPDACITQCGTRIYASGVQGRLERWESYIQEGFHRQNLKMALSCVEELELQESAYQGPAKLSYNIEEGCHGDALHEEIVHRACAVASCQILITKNKYVDILPTAAGKANALKYLYNHLLGLGTFGNGIPVKIITAGDSGNDWSMLREFNSILVPNGEEKLIFFAKTMHYDMIHVPRSGYAGGVLEGLRHYGVEV